MLPKGFPPNKCRLCGHTKLQGLNLYSTTAKRGGLLSKIEKCLSKEVVHIEIGDGLPKFICNDCEGIINSFTEFCDAVQKVQKTLEKDKFIFTQEAAAKEKLDLGTSRNIYQVKSSLNCTQSDPAATVSIGPDGKVECMMCQTYLEAVEHTTLHMVTHGIGTVICRCRACGQQGELAQFLCSSNTSDVGNTVWCTGCHFQSSKDKLRIDKVNNSTGKENACELCSKTFRSHGHLIRHRLVHSGAKPFLCEVCGTGFSQRSSLKLHVLSHAGINPHKCTHCGQSFRYRVSLRSHILSLHGSPSSTDKNVDYGCDRCGKQFATAYKLNRHYRSHTGETPYECTRCGKLFSQTGNLNLHKKKHEEEDAAAEVCLSSSANFNESIIHKEHLPNAMMEKQTPEPYIVALLTQQHNVPPTSDQYIPEISQVLIDTPDPKFHETILPHPVVPCDDLNDPGNPLTSIDTVLLNSTNKVSDHTSQYVNLNSEFTTASAHVTSDFLTTSSSTTAGTKTNQLKNTNELLSHFSHESLLFIDQPSELQVPSTGNTEGVTLPTFSSLQSASSVSIPNLTQ